VRSALVTCSIHFFGDEDNKPARVSRKRETADEYIEKVKETEDSIVAKILGR
jgi:hypothetical protein